jgi:hypothetical protein
MDRSDLYLGLQPAELDSVVCFDRVSRTVEEWYWRCRAGRDPDRPALARAVIAALGVDRTLRLIEINPALHADQHFAARYGIEGDFPGPTLARDAFRMLAAEHNEEACRALDTRIEAWLEGSDRAWQLPMTCESFIVCGGDIPRRLVDLYRLRHELRIAERGLEAASFWLVFALELLPDVHASALWAAVSSYYPEGREALVARLRPKMADTLERAFEWGGCRRCAADVSTACSARRA